MDDPKVIQIFIAYSRKDTDFLGELKTFLFPLEKNQSIKIWYDGEIVPGQVWENEIKQALHSAEIFLLLVSANSLASDDHSKYSGSAGRPYARPVPSCRKFTT